MTSGQKTLGNGLQIIWHNLPHTHSVYVGAFVRGGKHYETRKTNGASHLLEHLHLAKTRRHPTRAEFARACSSIPGEHNGLTSPEHLEFHFVTGPHWVKRAAELLADLLKPQEFDQELITTERKLIVSEIVAAQHFDLERRGHGVFFGAEPFGLSEMGTSKSIKRLVPRVVNAFDGQLFQPINMTVALAGPIDSSTLQAIEKQMEDLPNGDRVAATIPHPHVFDGPVVDLIQLHSRTRDVYVGFRIPKEMSGQNQVALWFLYQMLYSLDGGLFQSLRYGPVQTYYWNSWISTAKDSGAFQVWARVQPMEREKCLREIFREFGSLANSEIDPDIFEACRARLIHASDAALDHPNSIGCRIGSELCRKRDRPSVSIPEERAVLERITREDVCETANRIFRGLRCCVVIEGRRKHWWRKKVKRLVTEFLPVS